MIPITRIQQIQEFVRERRQALADGRELSPQSLRTALDHLDYLLPRDQAAQTQGNWIIRWVGRDCYLATDGDWTDQFADAWPFENVNGAQAYSGFLFAERGIDAEVIAISEVEA